MQKMKAFLEHCRESKKERKVLGSSSRGVKNIESIAKTRVSKSNLSKAKTLVEEVSDREQEKENIQPPMAVDLGTVLPPSSPQPQADNQIEGPPRKKLKGEFKSLSKSRKVVCSL